MKDTDLTAYLQLSETQLEDALHMLQIYKAAASAARGARVAAISQAIAALEPDPLEDGRRLNNSYLAASAALRKLQDSLREQFSVEVKVRITVGAVVGHLLCDGKANGR